METLFFSIVAAVAILSGILVITCRNPINSALSLILTFFCLATFYVMLDAPFMAAIQVIVYAGAIMVLIVFVIMLLNIRVETGKRYTHALWIGGIIGFLVLFQTCYILMKGNLSATKGLPAAGGLIAQSHTEVIGRAMFTNFVLPFEVTSILLLVAIVGSVILAKKKL